MDIHVSNELPGHYKGVEDSFEAGIRAWQESLTVTMLSSGGEDQSTVEVDESDLAITLNLEVTWPTSVSYSLRRKWKYQYIVINPY